MIRSSKSSPRGKTRQRVRYSFLSPVRGFPWFANVVPLDKKGREIPSSVKVVINLEYFTTEDAARLAYSL